MKYLSWAISIAMIGGAAFILIWGPRPATALPAGREHDVIIHYWEKWDGIEEQSMQQIVDDFNNTVGKQKHIFVEYLSISNIDQKTLLATAGGVPPDVAGMWDPEVAPFGIMGALEPLEKMAAAHGIAEGYYQPVFWKGCNYNGHLYALVSTPAAVALFYNKRIFHESADRLRAAGLDPDRAPRTLAELDRYAGALDTFKTGSDGKRHLERAGYLPSVPGWYITNMPLWFGSEGWDPKAHRFTLTDAGCEAAYEWIQGYSRRLGADAVTEFATAQGTFNSPQNEFIAGTVAMEMQGPWMANFIHHWKPEMDHDWAAAPFPSADGQKDVTYCPFDVLTIPTGSRHKKEAFEFIAFVNTQKEMEKLCTLHCKNSPLAKVSAEFIRDHPNPYIEVFQELSASPNAYGTMKCPIAPEAGAELQALSEGVVNLTVDARAGLATAQNRLQTEYELFMSRQAARQAAGQ